MAKPLLQPDLYLSLCIYLLAHKNRQDSELLLIMLKNQREEVPEYDTLVVVVF